MYKCLSITTNLQEMMVMLKSLPAYTLVFDKNCNLIDLNKPALQLLKINNVTEFNNRKGDVFLTHDYISTIIYELKKGKTVRHAKTLVKYAGDSRFSVVELCGCMINGSQDLFLFQLFDVSRSVKLSLGSFSYSTDYHVDMVDNSAAKAKKNRPLPKKNKQKELRTSESIIKTKISKIKEPKYRRLSKIETLVSELLALNLSLSQIASVTNKKEMAVRSIIRRVGEKQRINLIEGLGAEFKEHKDVLNVNELSSEI